MKRRLVVLTLVAPMAFYGCAAGGPREESGMVIGGALGGLLGSQVDGGRHGGGARTLAIIVGTLAGAAIGGAVGQSMDDTDRLKAAQTLENVRTGVSSAWRNPDTGVEYQMTPTRTYSTAQGPCREYSMEALIGGKTETVYGTACRQTDGSWKIVN